MEPTYYTKKEVSINQLFKSHQFHCAVHSFNNSGASTPTRSSRSHFAHPIQCPECVNETPCGRARSKSLEVDPLREQNDVNKLSYKSQNSRRSQVKEPVYSHKSRSYAAVNLASTSLPYNHLGASDKNMDPSTVAFTLMSSHKYKERQLPKNHLHQQRTSVAQSLLPPERSDTTGHAGIIYNQYYNSPGSLEKDKANVSSVCGENEVASHNGNFSGNEGKLDLKNHQLRQSLNFGYKSRQTIHNQNLPSHEYHQSGIVDKQLHDSHINTTSSPIEDLYNHKVENLRSKLLELRESDGKRIRKSSDSEQAIVTSPQKPLKRPRDNTFEYSLYHDGIVSSKVCGVKSRSLISHRANGMRAQLPSVPTKQLATPTAISSLSKINAQDIEKKLPSRPCTVPREIEMSKPRGEYQDNYHADVSLSFDNELGDSDQDCLEDFESSKPEELEEDSEEDTQSGTTTSSHGSNTSAVVSASLGSISLSDSISVASIKAKRLLLNSRISILNLPPSLRISLFSNVPPFIRFRKHDEKGETLPMEIHRLLRWKLSSITPLVVRRTLINTGFRLVRKSSEWVGTWGKHMKSICFKTLKDYQKINHFPGTFQIGRKDRLWKNLQRLMAKFGKKEFGFIPRTYVMPQDSRLLRQTWEKNAGKEMWIVKPPASARGAGIKVVNRWNQIPKKHPVVVQKYIARPYLINGSKFDLRLYVLVTSINPLRLYIYEDGLVRFASVKYSEDLSSLDDRFMHLTNYSINKLSSQYTTNEDSNACKGHKWTIKSLWTYLRKDGVNVDALWTSLVDLSIKTLISGESSINQLSRANLNSRYASYELFGIDVLLDVDLKPWLLEVNISPSLHSASPLDLVVKGPLVRDLMNMAGYQIPSKMPRAQQDGFLKCFGLRHLTGHLCFDKRLYTLVLSKQERTKHQYHQQTCSNNQASNNREYLLDILDELTPDDVRHLIQAEDEYTQSGNFTRIFPTTETHIYHDFFESPRYYNMLFDAWETKYHKNRQDGIDLLETFCLEKYHLTVPASGSVAKSYASQSSPSLDSSNGWMDESEDRPMSDRKVMSLSSMSIYRAARPRSGKFGIIARPYTRSVYLTRKQKSSTLPTSLAKCSSLDFATVLDESQAVEDR